MSFGGPDTTPNQQPSLGRLAKNVVLYLPREGDDTMIDPVSVMLPLPVTPVDAQGGPAAARLVDTGGQPIATSAAGLLVDTELPAAAALADAAANPTVPGVGAYLMGWNAATWDRVQVDTSAFPALRTAIYQGGVRIQSGGSSADAVATNSGSVLLSVRNTPILFNETSFDRQRGNVEGTLLASAARTTTTSTADQINYNSRGVRVFWNITAVPAVETITPTIEVKDPVSGVYTAILTGAARATTGHVLLEVYPGVGTTANLIASDVLSRTWRVTFTHSASGSFTYSAGFSLIL